MNGICLRGALAILLAFSSTSAIAQVSQQFSAEQVKRGADLYEPHCTACHGIRLANPEWAIDLRTFPRDQRSRFIDAVTHGKTAMPPWGDVLKPDDIEALWAYLVAGEKK